MSTLRYDFHVKVPGNSKPYYVVRRRVIDGGYECSCPRWVEAREECRHVRLVREAMDTLPRVESKLEHVVARVVRRTIQNEKELAARIVKAILREVV